MPTLKQKKAFQAVGVNGGNISKAMVEAGYSPSVSKRTDKLTNTKGWEELMSTCLSDELLAERHLELLNKRDIRFSAEGEELSNEPDTQAVTKALDMAYKIKDKYAPEKHTNVTLNLNDEQRDKAINAIRNLRS